MMLKIGRDYGSNLFKWSRGESKRDFTLSPDSHEDLYDRSLLGLQAHCFNACRSFGCMGNASFLSSNGCSALRSFMEHEA